MGDREDERLKTLPSEEMVLNCRATKIVKKTSFIFDTPTGNSSKT